LVWLTTREHYVAHRLLSRAFPFDDAMAQAVWLMAQRRVPPGSRVYEAVRARVVEASSARLKNTRETQGAELEAKRVAGVRRYHQSEAGRKATREAAKLRPLKIDAAIAAVSRPVVCLELGEEFPSAAAAARWCHLQGYPKATGNVIGQCADPRMPNRLTAYGYTWAFKDGTAPRNKPADHRRSLPKVVRVSTGEVFPTAYLAAQLLGNHRLQASIIRVCKTGKGTAAGEQWKFAE
jgi:hypothetical protein